MRFGIFAVFAVAIAVSLDTTNEVFAEVTTMVILVRHAEKVDMSFDSELSAAGVARAHALHQAIADTQIDRIIVTQYKRTRLTAAVVSDSVGIELTVVSVSGGLAAHVNAVADAVRADGASAVLVVGHSNTIPAIIGALGGPHLGDLDESEYSNLFILQIPKEGKPRLIRSHYGAPDGTGSY